MNPAADPAASAKRDPRDFAPVEGIGPVPSWPTPGATAARLASECSAMAAKGTGGAEFDIHGGGIDLDVPAPRERDRAVAGGR